MSLTLLWHLGDLGHWGQTRDEAGTGMHVPPQPRPCCATALGPAGSSCLSSEFLSGGNRQVNIPDQLIRIRCEATGLASQLSSAQKHHGRDLSRALLGQDRGGNADPGQGDRAQVPSGTSKMHPVHILPQSNITMARSISCSSQCSPPAWDGALL